MAGVESARRPAAPARAALRELLDAFEDHRLLTFASATSFQILTAIVPFLLFAFALLGFLDLGRLWRADVAPELAPTVSPAAFSVIDTTVTRVLGEKQVFWMTLGLALAIWQVSGAVRAVMDGFDLIYRSDDPRRRSFWARIGRSLVLALAIGGCLLLAIAVVVLGPLLVGSPDGALGALVFLVRWLLAAALLLLAVGLLFRFAPEQRPPARWAGRGSLLVVGGWVAASLLFGFYVRNLASVESVFGALASVVIGLAYLYLSTTVFFAGAELEARSHEREGQPLQS